MRSWARLIGVGLVALVAAGCASRPDYASARRSRDDRPYRGGAAEVPDEDSPSASSGRPWSALDLFGFFGAIALMASRNVDHSGSGSRPVPITASPR